MNLSSLKEIEGDVWVFDNDGTLYQDRKGLESAVVILMNQYIAKLYGIDLVATHQKRKALLEKHKTKYTLIALKNEGVDENHFILHTYLAIRPEQYGIVKNHRLRDVLTLLKGEKIVLSNNPSAFADLILKALGIRDLFSCIYGPQELSFTQKPMREAFVILNPFLNTNKKVVFIDDELENVNIAKNIGCTTVLVGSEHSALDQGFADFWMSSLS